MKKLLLLLTASAFSLCLNSCVSSQSTSSLHSRSASVALEAPAEAGPAHFYGGLNMAAERYSY